MKNFLIVVAIIRVRRMSALHRIRKKEMISAYATRKYVDVLLLK